MSSDTAEPTIANVASELAMSARADTLVDPDSQLGAEIYPEQAPLLNGRLGGAAVDATRIAAVRDVWRALWSSRLLVWIAGVGSVLVLGSGKARHAFDPPGITHGLGRLGDLLAAPAARWDAAWYLVIAHYGYRPDLGAFTASRTAFFPLYPLSVRLLSDLGSPLVLAGVLSSLVALAVGLYCLHRLTTLEAIRLNEQEKAVLGKAVSGKAVGLPATDAVRLRNVETAPRPSEIARVSVLLTAFAPMAFYFSAVYSESLYLALSVGAFLSARRGRWGLAALLAALAGAARSTGVVLILPLALLYLYGPRDDRPPDYPPRRDSVSLLRGLRPRYRLRPNALWLALIPAGLGIYVAHLAYSGGDPLAPFHAEAVWSRHFAGPYGGVWDGAKAAFEGLRQLLSFQRHHVYYPAAGGSPFIDAGHNLLLFAFLLAAIPAVIGVLRLLPSAYGLYALASLALPLSYPVAPQPLMSLPRFLVVLFPLNMWLATRLVSHPIVFRRAVLVLSAAAMMFFVGEFATWHWVA